MGGGCVEVFQFFQLLSEDFIAENSRHSVADSHLLFSCEEIFWVQEEAAPQVGKGKMTKVEFKAGDRVAWKYGTGKATGHVVEKLTEATKLSGRTYKANNDEPKYRVKSEKSGKSPRLSLSLNPLFPPLLLLLLSVSAIPNNNNNNNNNKTQQAIRAHHNILIKSLLKWFGSRQSLIMVPE